jgi:hypothetical protein
MFFLDMLNVADIKQHLIYVDDKNFIRDVYSTGSDWTPETVSNNCASSVLITRT